MPPNRKQVNHGTDIQGSWRAGKILLVAVQRAHTGWGMGGCLHLCSQVVYQSYQASSLFSFPQVT